MQPRIQGRLKTWNADRGFGFIVPDNGGQEIFVHVTDYPRHGGVPTVGERLSFEIALNREGKKKAVKVQRPGVKRQDAVRGTSGGVAMPILPSSRAGRRRLGPLPALLVVATLGIYGYFTQQHRPEPAEAEPVLRRAIPEVQYVCDGRQYCSQMRSCAEAKFFLKNCPNTKMDGDHDGIPCEQQWC